MLDFIHTSDGDLDLSGDDIIVGDATLQHQRDAILTSPGALKHSPTSGVGVEEYFNDDSAEDLLRKIRQELIKDGCKVKSLAIVDGEIQITGYYEADYNS